MNIGGTIKHYLDYRGISQKELAQSIDKSETAISQFINNEYNPTHVTLIKISQALGIPLPVLIFHSLEEEDITDNKLPTFRLIKPIVMALLDTLVEEKENTKIEKIKDLLK